MTHAELCGPMAPVALTLLSPARRDLLRAWDIVHHENQPMVVIPILYLDVHAGVRHPARVSPSYRNLPKSCQAPNARKSFRGAGPVASNRLGSRASDHRPQYGGHEDRIIGIPQDRNEIG